MADFKNCLQFLLNGTLFLRIDENGTHVDGFLCKTDPFGQNIPVYLNMWVPPRIYPFFWLSKVMPTAWTKQERHTHFQYHYSVTIKY